jgi:hypothetical protein
MSSSLRRLRVGLILAESACVLGVTATRYRAWGYSGTGNSRVTLVAKAVSS